MDKQKLQDISWLVLGSVFFGSPDAMEVLLHSFMFCCKSCSTLCIYYLLCSQALSSWISLPMFCCMYTVKHLDFFGRVLWRFSGFEELASDMLSNELPNLLWALAENFIIRWIFLNQWGIALLTIDNSTIDRKEIHLKLRYRTVWVKYRTQDTDQKNRAILSNTGHLATLGWSLDWYAVCYVGDGKRPVIICTTIR